MNTPSWNPSTFEDRLLNKYLSDHPGTLFLEVRVGGTHDALAARRIDGILVPGPEREVRPPQSYSEGDLRSAINGRQVDLIEAKRSLNRNVFGQVLAGSGLFCREFKPAQVRHVALCAVGEPDLEWVCKEHGVEVIIYPVETGQPDSGASKPGADDDATRRQDVRREPDAARRRAFLSGWTDATNGHLYESVRQRKTHANMGNLFGWIYGDQDLDFRLETWDRYVDQLGGSPTNRPG